MKKILFVMQSFYNGGAEKSLVNLLNELPKGEYEIDLLLFKKEGMFLEQIPNDVSVLETPKRLRALYAPVRKAGAMVLIKILGTVFGKLCETTKPARCAYRWKHVYTKFIPKMDKHYDVAVAYISGEVLYFVDEKVNADRKLVWIHNDYKTAGHPKKYDYPHLKNMNAIISVSEQCVNILKEEFEEFQNKILHIPNITSSIVTRKRAQDFRPSEYENISNILLSIGRLKYQKGFDIAIQAAAILKEQHVDFKWFVIGDGEEEESLKKMIEDYKVQDSFIMLGTRSNPYPYIENCTIFVQPSRYEGKSVVLDEAKIIGKAIVATAYPTVKDQIAEGKEGLIAEMSPEHIAKTIRDLLINSDKRKNIENYLLRHEYGNQSDVYKYIELFQDESIS